jgi:hypothetical protein
MLCVVYHVSRSSLNAANRQYMAQGGAQNLSTYGTTPLMGILYFKKTIVVTIEKHIQNTLQILFLFVPKLALCSLLSQSS